MRTLWVLMLGWGCTGGDKAVEPVDSEPVVDTEVVPHTDPPTCAEIEADYAALVGPAACEAPEDCELLNGACGLGLGGCYELSNGSTTQAQLDELGLRYADAGCTSGVCDCAEPPAVDCVEQVCVPAEPAPRCVWTATSSLPGVTLLGPDVPCTYTLAGADLGVSFTWTALVSEPVAVVVDAVSCAGLDDSGLRFLELVSSTGTVSGEALWCPRCDLGRCPNDEDESETVTGSWDHTFTWRPRQWTGPSDFGQQPGELFAPGDYVLTVVARGRLLASGDPWTARLQTTVTLLP
jgi:hypothetical protein